MRSIAPIAFIMMVGVSVPAAAVIVCTDGCGLVVPSSFTEPLSDAQNVFVFRLVSSELYQTDAEGHRSERIDGNISIEEVLKGSGADFAKITYATTGCALQLDVGHYYLAVTSQSNSVLRLGLADSAVIDISPEYFSDSEPDDASPAPRVEAYSLRHSRDRILGQVQAVLAGAADVSSVDVARYWNLTHPQSILPVAVPSLDKL